MVQLLAYRRSLRLVALALCSLTLAVVSIAPASARPTHSRHAHSAHAGSHARHYARHHYRHAARLSRAERDAAQTQTFGFADANAAVMSGAAVPNTGGVTAADSFGSPGIVARRGVISVATRPADPRRA